MNMALDDIGEIGQGGSWEKATFGAAHLPNFGCVRGTKNSFFRLSSGNFSSAASSDGDGNGNSNGVNNSKGSRVCKGTGNCNGDGDGGGKAMDIVGGGREVTRTLIMTMTTSRIDANDTCLPILLRQQHLGIIIVGGIKSPCVVITESLPPRENDRDGWRTTMTTMRTLAIGGG
jgi:hypothetical protein